MPSLETPRLILHPIALADADQIQQIFPQWDIVQYLNAKVPWPYPPDGALIFIRDHALPAAARGDEWHWTLRLQADPDRILGAIGLSRSDTENRGFWIVPEFRRQGLMTEAVCAVNDYWFDVLGFPVLRAPKGVANLASRRISEKTGMRCIGTEQRPLVSGLQTSEIWETTAAEWRALRRSLGVRV
jgi:RimJ/RimL family protein N-acetyltransferase